ncbi:hypothetical protein FD724_33850 (plasmid) [Nostoc sp. C057]|uniref:pentapeptide repeat-containing protein n=1 Tax=Nostoc sp. C057 TaxID=2576903 RepID=UPI0015C2CA3A|nr:pentapeptide repeat-containing protein [Nostoc sp. C057]QLE52944.1 hypothetical protein FD724_33850 [Nostoc sp. C057]
MPQDFSGQNLRGRSFKGQNLEGANFSGADIKSADFTGANLTDANFSHAKAGLQKRWAILLTCTSWLLVGISGFFSAFAGNLVQSPSHSNLDSWIGSLIFSSIVSLTAWIVLIFFFKVIISKGINEAFTIAVPFAITTVVVVVITGATAASQMLSRLKAIPKNEVLSTPSLEFFKRILSVMNSNAVAVPYGVAIAAVFALVAVALALLIAITGATAVAKAKAITGTTAVAKAKAVAVPEVLALAFAVAGATVGACFMVIAGSTDVAAIEVKAVAAAVILSLFNICIARQAFEGDKNAIIRTTAITLAAFGGTSFRKANLTDANFIRSSFKSTDFREANLTRTCFNKTEKLDCVRPGTTYLQKRQVVNVLITGKGQEKNFDREDLRGVNFTGANLVDASFIGADLSQANLQDADLSRAKLVQTQLNGTDLTGATLTGAYIQDWGITTDTKFDGVRCEYVYMRLPTKENPDPLRKPDNNKEVFADGEFGEFIQPIFDTLDLYHNQGVDPRAIAISFKQLAENHPDAELEIVAMEKRGEDKFLLRAKTAIAADKSQLSAEYVATYNEIKSLPEREIRLLLSEKDNQIRRLENMVMTALERPSFYSNVEQVGFMSNNPGGFSVGGSVGGNVNNVQGNNNRAVQGDNNQAVLGDNNQVTQQNQVGADTGESLTKEDVIKLLAQLETLIKGAELPADTKEELVEDLSAAKKATDKEEPNKQRALERLGTVAETLEKTSKSVEAGQKIWTTAKPIIVKVATWLGVAAGSHLLGL